MRRRRSASPWLGCGDIDAGTPIVVVKVTRSLVQHGVLGIARSAGSLGIPVYWAHTPAAAPAARSRYIRGVHRLPDGPDVRERSVERLIALGQALGGEPVLVPVDDPGAVLVADHAETLAPWFRFPRLPDGRTRSLLDKRDLHDLCLALGLPTPSARFPLRRADLEDYAAGGAFPVVLKRAAPSLPAELPVTAGTTLIRKPDGLRRMAERLGERGAAEVMLQEHIPGGPDSVWMYDGYFDRRTACRFGLTGRKLRQCPPDTGMTALGVCEPNAAVEASAVRLMRAVDYHGIVDMGFRYDRRDGLYKLLDVNPRIGATFRLFAAGGMDVLRAMYLDLTGQPAGPQPAPDAGRRFLVEPHDVQATLGSNGRRPTSAGEWARSLRGVDEAAWWSAADPLPALAMAATLARRSLRRRRT